ncbi:uncharacterized protein ACOB8E_005950 isoform 2-T2 [Sarcophilus harrisii]
MQGDGVELQNGRHSRKRATDQGMTPGVSFLKIHLLRNHPYGNYLSWLPHISGKKEYLKSFHSVSWLARCIPFNWLVERMERLRIVSSGGAMVKRRPLPMAPFR